MSDKNYKNFISENFLLGRTWNLGVAVFLIIAAICNVRISNATAQVVPDKSLGAESSVVTPNVEIDETMSDRIDGGMVRGTNLFHSFQEFSVDEGRRAYFTNPDGVQNILSRVSGNNSSTIFGKLGVLGNANLFLINPNGIIFGVNARLDLDGSFIASTANSIKLADGSEFSTVFSQEKPLLTTSVPVGLGFGSKPGAINVLGTGEGVSATTDLPNVNIGLGVRPNRTLALLGGDISLEGGALTAEEGRIELGSVTDFSFVGLNPISTGWTLNYRTHLGSLMKS